MIGEIDSFDKPIQKGMKMIERNWDHFTAFYFFEGGPATNNPHENYYSTSLKTHRKKQFRTEQGIKNQLKFSAMKWAGIMGLGQKTLLEMLLMFIPFMCPW